MVRKWLMLSSFIFSIFLLTACQTTNNDALQEGITAYFNHDFKQAEMILSQEDDELAQQWLDLIKLTKEAVATTIDEETEVNPFQAVKKADISFMGTREKELFEERLTQAEKEAEERITRAKQFATLNEETKKEWIKNKEELANLSVNELVRLFSTSNDETELAVSEVRDNSPKKETLKKNDAAKEVERQQSPEALAKEVRNETKGLIIATTDIITNLLKADAPFDSEEEALLQYVTPELYTKLKKHYEAGDFCYQCDVPHIPGQYDEITFKTVEKVDEHDAYIIYTEYGLNSEGFEGEIPMQYHYKKIDGDWKLHSFKDL